MRRLLVMVIWVGVATPSLAFHFSRTQLWPAANRRATACVDPSRPLDVCLPPAVHLRASCDDRSHEDAVLQARQVLVDTLMKEAWAGKDGHCTSESEDAEIDSVAGEL
jgi:hypothetical protein